VPKTARRRAARLAVGLGLLVVGVAALWWGLHRPPPPAPLPRSTFVLPPATLPPGGPPAGLADAPAGGGATTTVAPWHVDIPSLGVDAPLVVSPVVAGFLSIPPNVHRVALWNGGALPGDRQGTVLLASHVNWWDQGPGVFYRLSTIRPRSLVIVTGAPGMVTRWSVTSLQVMLHRNIPQSIFTKTGPSRLVLVTCGGPYNPSTHSYIDNVVVTATPIDAR
jgi:hypothetical protein